MDGMDYDPMMMDGDSEQPQVKISAVCEAQRITNQAVEDWLC
jgi:hypothetical protein